MRCKLLYWHTCKHLTTSIDCFLSFVISSSRDDKETNSVQWTFATFALWDGSLLLIPVLMTQNSNSCKTKNNFARITWRKISVLVWWKWKWQYVEFWWYQIDRSVWTARQPSNFRSASVVWVVKPGKFCPCIAIDKNLKIENFWKLLLYESGIEPQQLKYPISVHLRHRISWCWRWDPTMITLVIQIEQPCNHRWTHNHAKQRGTWRWCDVMGSLYWTTSSKLPFHWI